MPIPFFCFRPIHPWCNPVEIEPRLSDPLFGHGEWKHIFHFHTLIQRSGDNLKINYQNYMKAIKYID